MDGYITIGTELDTKEFDAQIIALERKMNELEQELQLAVSTKRPSGEIQEIQVELEKTKNKLIQLNRQKDKLEQSSGVKGLTQDVGGLGNSIENAIHKVTRLALGVFAIRSAYMAVRQASSELASYNPQYAANLEYIRYALTQLIAPVLEYILNLARTVLAYINYIAQAWFGVNLFANASAESFKKVKNNIGGASSAAKELQKTLAGFDEMNILNSSSTGGGGGVGGALSPDFDLSDLSDIEIPDWIKWIADNKSTVVGAIKAIAEAFLIFKTLQIAKVLSGVKDSIFTVMSGLSTFNKFLLGLGIGLIIYGIIQTVEALITWIKDPSWKNFREVLLGLETVILGVAAAMIALNATNPLGWIILIIDAIAMLVTWLDKVFNAESEEEKQVRELKEAEERLKEARENLTSATKDYIDAVERAEEKERKLKEAQDETGISIDELLTLMDKEGWTYKDLNEQQRKVYKAYVEEKDAKDKLKESTDKLNQSQQEEMSSIFQLIGNLAKGSKSFEDYRNAVVKAYQDGKINSKQAAEVISAAMSAVDDETKKVFQKNIPEEIKNSLNPDKYAGFRNSFISTWNDMINKLNKNIKVNASANVSYKVATSVEPIKMATGGLVNMPNRGVPVTNAIAGEAGAEGIIPLTDQQAMAQLGAEIGRNVLVNLTNITSMNGRIISRELKKVQSEENFAFNT